MAGVYDIGLVMARELMLAHLKPLDFVTIPIAKAGGRVVARDCVARVDCPVAPTSLRDGYAVVSTDLDRASERHPVRLQLRGTMVAGGETLAAMTSGWAVKVMTGARLPSGATAVVACEYTQEGDGWVECMRDASCGRNVLTQGHDVTQGHTVARRGEQLTPAQTGLLAAAGLTTVSVHPRPRVALMGVGDELVCPGQTLNDGQLYASNLVTLCSWLRAFHMTAEMTIVPDDQVAIRQGVEQALCDNDVVLTSGGAWKSDRDLTVRTLVEMGGEVIFHRIRMGPGKALAFVCLHDKAVFCLPGGPPSNEMAFLQVVLPGLLQLAGLPTQAFRLQTAHLTQPVSGMKDWTQFFQARLFQQADNWCVTPLIKGSRLQSQADANALIEIPEGEDCFAQGEPITVQVLMEPYVDCKES